MYCPPIIAYRSFQGTTNQVFDFPVILHILSIQNCGDEPLIFTASTKKKDLFRFEISPGELFWERIDRYCRVKVEAKGPYKGLVYRSDDVFWDAEYLDN